MSLHVCVEDIPGVHMNNEVAAYIEWRAKFELERHAFSHGIKILNIEFNWLHIGIADEWLFRADAKTEVKMPNGHCFVPDCEELTAGQICDKHWKRLMIGMRRRYWNETEYGKERASDELKAAILDALEQTAELDKKVEKMNNLGHEDGE